MLEGGLLSCAVHLSVSIAGASGSRRDLNDLLHVPILTRTNEHTAGGIKVYQSKHTDDIEDKVRIISIDANW